jgi:hypothetical protein
VVQERGKSSSGDPVTSKAKRLKDSARHINEAQKLQDELAKRWGVSFYSRRRRRQPEKGEPLLQPEET